MSKVILMKVTSRERPHSLIQCVNRYIELANNTNDMVWLFSFDTDDQLTTPIINQLPKNSEIVFGHSENKIHAINRDVNNFGSNWDILLNISDDQLPVVKGYDETIRNFMPDHLDVSLWFNDGWQTRINTQEILGRKYYERFNYIYNPEYKSFFCDNESTLIAEKLGKLIKTNQHIIKHFHPGWDKTQKQRQDNLYTKNDKYWNEDQETFNKRKSINFGL
jgi:hypothetical protein